jgi:hypothetical protein
MNATPEIVLFLSLSAPALLIGSGDSDSSGGRVVPAIEFGGAGAALPVKRLLYAQSGRSPAGIRARWLGQDKHDFVGPHQRLEPSDVQDIHLALGGLDVRREVVFVDVTGEAGDHWQYGGTAGWRAELRRGKQARTADLFVEPARAEVGQIHIVVRYDDGTTADASLPGRKADPQLRMPGAGLVARWVGQDRQDWTGPGPSVGPDGLQDVHIVLGRLGPLSSLKGIRIEGPAGARWESGTNPKLASNAELVRDEKEPFRGDLFFQPERDLSSQRIKLTVLYDNDRSDSITIAAGRCDPKLRMPQATMPRLVERAATAEWLGQDGKSTERAGDVHVRVSGLSTSSPIAGAILSDSVRGLWAYRASDRAMIPAPEGAERLDLKFGARRSSADLFFAPYRDEVGTSFSLCLFGSDGRIALVRFPGGPCDLGRRAPAPQPARVDAKPGDDIQGLVDRHGVVVLGPGIYPLRAPLLLNHPVTLTSEGGATLRFAQAAGDSPWTTAIKVHCGNTTLNGFAVRFEGPVRWNQEVSWGPAVIGMTDNLDQGHDDLKVNVVFTHLDLEVPPVEKHDGWVEAVRLMRLIRARSGVISHNKLRGGTIECFDGPWQMVGNDFRGAPPGTFSHGVFTAHNPHDLQVHDNRTQSPDPSGKTWRFLVLTGSGFGDVIERNVIKEIGARDDDTIPWNNEPEIILTEGYTLRYEGRVMSLSADGRLMRIGRPQGDAPWAGDVVSLLSGPAAGQWRRVVMAVGAHTYLVDPPVPAGTDVVSISPGFVSEVFQENRIDIRGGRRSVGLILPGNIFGVRVVKNHFLGGAHAFQLSAYPTEKPMMWGWSHAPFLGGVIEGNVIEDTEGGGLLGLQHDPRYIKSNQGRTYMSVQLNQNLVRWSEPFLRRVEQAGTNEPLAGLTLGHRGSNDPSELVVTAAGNRLDSPRSRRQKPALHINAALYNHQRIVNRRVELHHSAGGSGGEAKAGAEPSRR